jgi:hypothetical protein
MKDAKAIKMGIFGHHVDPDWATGPLWKGDRTVLRNRGLPAREA